MSLPCRFDVDSLSFLSSWRLLGKVVFSLVQAGDNDAVIRIFVVALAAAIGGGGGDADPGGCQWGEHDDDAAARR